MERGLVFIENTDSHRKLLQDAKEHALGSDAELVLLVTLTEAEYEETQEMLDTIGTVENTSYTDDEVFAAATNDAEELARDVLKGEDVSYTIVPKIADEDERADAVISVAREQNCDHVFVLGRQRSPTGKALFGDLAQRVVLDFDGFVTLATE